MLRYTLMTAPLLAFCLAASAQQQSPLRPKPPMGPVDLVSGSMPPPMMGKPGVPSGTVPGLPLDGPRAGRAPMGLPDSRMPPMPRLRPQYTPSGQMPLPPMGQGR